MARGHAVVPAGEPVRNVGRVAIRSGDAQLQSPPGGDSPRVVNTGGPVELALAGARLDQDLLQPVAGGRAEGAVLDHAFDLVLGARGLAEARMGALVRLHQARVGVAVVGRPDAHAAIGFLHDNGEDEAGVDAAGLADRLDGRLELGRFLLRVWLEVLPITTRLDEG